MINRILRIDDVIAMTGLGRTTIYGMLKHGTFPKPVKLGARAVGWREADVGAWIDGLPESQGGHHA